jgi:hypothetical protein
MNDAVDFENDGCAGLARGVAEGARSIVGEGCDRDRSFAATASRGGAIALRPGKCERLTGLRTLSPKYRRWRRLGLQKRRRDCE